jgi:NADH-quinone oxidoreductase subunit A
MGSYVQLVGYLVVFTFIAASFLLITLLIGRIVRPIEPNPEKDAIYECGEPTIGSSWVQFDLRFYVVALLFVIFDVEVAFFFPWAAVFGKTIRVADPSRSAAEIQKPLEELGFVANPATLDVAATQNAAWTLAGIAFVDLLVFFGVVLVGFAYLWKRGDLDWVRASMNEPQTESPATWSEAPSEPVAVRAPESAAV